MENYHILPKISIIIRALNEAKYLPECLQKISEQNYMGDLEVILVDSGSTDATVEIAAGYGCKLVFITKQDFSYGKSLNMGCAASEGDILVILSAHCIPVDGDWLRNLIDPLLKGEASYSYGKQITRDGVSRYSEGIVYKKYYPDQSASPQLGYFCNNANAAILRDEWQKFKFNEDLTGLEDMELAKRIVTCGGKVSYIAESCVEHIHEETWARIKIRYEREAVALKNIDPSLNISFLNALNLLIISVYYDFKCKNKSSLSDYAEIISYRFCQFYGAYLGGRASRKRINAMRNQYFFPKASRKTVNIGVLDENNSFASHESTQ